MSKRLGGVTVGVLIPAFNEVRLIGDAVAGLPGDLVDTILVVDNRSDDGTGDAAREAGAKVIYEPKRGYGRACLSGIGWYREHRVDILLFIDADGADDPSITYSLLEPIVSGDADLVIGSRLIGEMEPGAMPPHVAFGNRLAVFMIKKMFGHTYTDLGPFRAIRWSALEKLGMVDEDFGWTVEMQVKALIQGIRVKEIAAPYRRRREGKSKISGTVRGTIMAGWKIITTIIKLRLG